MDILLIGLIGSAIYFGPDYLDKIATNQKQDDQVEVIQYEASSEQLELNNLSKQYDPLNPDAVYVEPSIDEVDLVEIKTPTHQPSNEKNKILGGLTEWYEGIKLKSKARLDRHTFVRNRSPF